MENIRLTLKAYHLPQLCEAVRARAMIVNTDTSSTATEKAVCADLEQRVNLLARAVATERAAQEARARYNIHIHNAPEPSGRKKGKEARKLLEQIAAPIDATDTADPVEQPQEPPQTEPEAATASSADVVKRTI